MLKIRGMSMVEKISLRVGIDLVRALTRTSAACPQNVSVGILYAVPGIPTGVESAASLSIQGFPVYRDTCGIPELI
jgi:hypothetical protein